MKVGTFFSLVTSKSRKRHGLGTFMMEGSRSAELVLKCCYDKTIQHLAV